MSRHFLRAFVALAALLPVIAFAQPSKGCEAEIRAGSAPDVVERNLKSSRTQFADADVAMAEYYIDLHSEGAAKGNPVEKCFFEAWKLRKAQLTVVSIPAETRAKAPVEKKEAVRYVAPHLECVRKGTEGGHVTYTNICKESIEIGYCHVEAAKEGDGSVCRPSNSEFSKSGKSYVTQSAGLEPGASHTEAYAYHGLQHTFLVACKDSFPIIDGFPASGRITGSSRARMACWTMK
jgi:hypothetical protein